MVREVIRVEFHQARGRMTSSSRTFGKEGPQSMVQVDPLEEPPTDSELNEEHMQLLHLERECTNGVRDVEKEVAEIVQQRIKDEQAVTLVTPYYDIVHEQLEHSDGEEEAVEAAVERDYLTPFMPPGIGHKPLDKAQAKEVREKCLKALKDRLIKRANIIQTRHDDETAQLAKRQATFQRDRDTMSHAEEVDYETACEEALFRIRILEQRLMHHEEQALQKYYKLDERCACCVCWGRDVEGGGIPLLS